MHYFYIIFSKKINRYYSGETCDPKNRLKQHNDGYYDKAFTKVAKDWEIVLIKKYKTRKETLEIEKFVKKMKSKKFIEKIIKNPAILDEIKF